MNIIVTSRAPVQCAKYIDDKRVISQIKEFVQMLCTALSIKGVKSIPVRPSHEHHPVTRWVAISRENYCWLLRHTLALMYEKRRRFPDNPPHIYEKHISYLRASRTILPSFMLTPFANCACRRELGIDYTHIEDVELAYKLYMADRWEIGKVPPKWYGK